MDTIKAYFNGSVFVPLTSVNVKINQPVLITILEPAKSSSNCYSDFFGTLPAEDFIEIVEALKDTEKVDVDEW